MKKRWGNENLGRRARLLLGMGAGMVVLFGVTSCAHMCGPSGGAGGGVSDQSAPDVRGPVELDGLENVHRASDGVYCGSVPASREAFASLARLVESGGKWGGKWGGDSGGVLTVVSVDGAEPELDLAHAVGMRYVHIPIGYDGVDEVAMAQLAAVMRDLPRPIYVHCHHGKHRGPAATAAGLVAIGEISAEEGVALMRRSGTSEAYSGLYRVVASAGVLNDMAVTLAGLDLVEWREVSGLVASMVEINHAFDRLKLTREADWGEPAEHPDLAPAAEAGIIKDLLANLAKSPGAADEPDSYRQMLAASVSAADQLEAGLVRGTQKQADEHERNYQLLKQTCTDCHLQYRNQ